MKRGPGLPLFIVLLVLVAAYAVASRTGYIDKALARLFPEQVQKARLSPGDFPAGVAAPVGDLASVPLRPVLIGFTPRGSSAALLLATGGTSNPNPEARPPDGLLKSAYALDARAVIFAREEDLKRALAGGAEAGGVDMAAISVDRLAQWGASLRDAAPRTVMMLGRSRGQEALAAVGIKSIAELRGKRVGTYRHGSANYFALWLLSQAGLTVTDVTWVELASTIDAGAALREGKVDAAVGFLADVELAAKDRGGIVLATTADAPHLIATVLVARGDFAARYPDAVRRTLRGMLEAGAAVNKDPLAGARLLGEAAPYLGDPRDAIKSAPPADLHDNLAFFGLAGEAPVTYDELFASASAMYEKLGRSAGSLRPEDSRDLNALRYVAEARGR